MTGVYLQHLPPFIDHLCIVLEVVAQQSISGDEATTVAFAEYLKRSSAE